MLVETDGHTVPHFKAPVYAKMELWGPESGGTFSIQTSLLNISHLLHKMGFVPTEVDTTVYLGVKLKIYDEVSKPTGNQVEKLSNDIVVCEIPESGETFARLGMRSSKDSKELDLDYQLQIAHISTSSSIPSSSTTTISSEAKPANSNTYIKNEESLYEKPIEVYDLRPELNIGGGLQSNGIWFKYSNFIEINKITTTLQKEKIVVNSVEEF